MKEILKLAAALCILCTGSVEAEAAPNGITVVGDHESVCMVTDRYMDVPQIPVQTNGNTYYGCCQGCVGKIQNDAGVRNAADPITGISVDKAQSVIAKDDAGKVYYFESEKTFQLFLEKSGK